MRSAQLQEYPRPLELIEKPEPAPAAPRDVGVKIGGAGVCATDLHAQEGQMEPAGLSLPVVLGRAGRIRVLDDHRRRPLELRK